MNPETAPSAARRRLLLVTPDYPPHPIGGGAFVCEHLAREYRQLGWDVTVFAMNAETAGSWVRPTDLATDHLRVVFYPMMTRIATSGFSLLLVIPPSWTGLFHLFREFRGSRWDAVHLHGNPATLVDLVAVLCRLRGTPFVVTFHGTMGTAAQLGKLGGSLFRLFAALERGIFRGATAITSVSAATLDEVRGLGFRAGRMVVVPNAGEMPSPPGGGGPPSTAGPDPKAALAEQPFVLCLGAFIPRKGQDLLVEAFAELRTASDVPRSLRLVLAGYSRDPSFLASLRTLVAKRGLNDRVQFLGEVSDAEKAELLTRARWVVMPSRYEASPVLAFEALARGCVLIAPDLPNFREVIGDGPCGLYFRPQDAHSLSATMAALLRNPQQEQAARHAGLKRAASFADWGRIARAYLELFPHAAEPGVRTEAMGATG